MDAENTPSLCSIYDYLDYRMFLKERMTSLQSVDRKYSQRWLAKKAGIKSPQLLTMIVQGQRNLTKDKLPGLCVALKLNDKESEYFQYIVELAHASTREEQIALSRKISTHFQDGLFSPISENAAEFFAAWYYPAMRELVAFPDSHNDPKWFADKLKISEEEAQKGLEVLLRHGFIKPDGERFVRSEPSVRTSKNKTYPMYLAQYHMRSLELAFNALSLPRSKRHFQFLTFAIPESKMPEVQEAIQKFIRELDVMVESYSESREAVYQITTALYPLPIP